MHSPPVLKRRRAITIPTSNLLLFQTFTSLGYPFRSTPIRLVIWRYNLGHMIGQKLDCLIAQMKRQESCSYNTGSDIQPYLWEK